MGKVKLLQGESCQVEYLRMDEGDSKRHRAHCLFYTKAKGYCSKYSEKCHGSTYCQYYVEKEINVKTVEEQSHIKSFSGVKKINMRDISLQKKYSEPTKEKIREQINYYNQNLRFDKPVVVEVHNNRYVLIDKYLRYYVAKLLGLEMISAEINEKELQSQRDALRCVGTLVWSNRYSEAGEVVAYSDEQVTIKYDDGKEVDYDIHQCLEKNTLRVL